MIRTTKYSVHIQVLKTVTTMLKDRGFFITSCWSKSALVKGDEPLSNVDELLDNFGSLPGHDEKDRVHTVMEAVTMDQKGFAKRVAVGTKARVYLVFDGCKVGKNPMLSIISQAKEDGIDVVIVPILLGVTPHANKEILMAKFDDDISVQAFSFDWLRVPIASHELIPSYHLLTKEEIGTLMTHYKLEDVFQLPRQRTSDTVSRYYGLQKGDVIKVVGEERYRVVIPDGS